MKSNKDKFLELYKRNLKEQITLDPQNYAWNISELDVVFERMRSAIIRGTFNKDSKAFRLTCKELKIKHTYKDIKNFIEKENYEINQQNTI
jgi:hypothetical protein